VFSTELAGNPLTHIQLPSRSKHAHQPCSHELTPAESIQEPQIEHKHYK
jgi:hypothetical protein